MILRGDVYGSEMSLLWFKQENMAERLALQQIWRKTDVVVQQLQKEIHSWRRILEDEKQAGTNRWSLFLLQTGNEL